MRISPPFTINVGLSGHMSLKSARHPGRRVVPGVIHCNWQICADPMMVEGGLVAEVNGASVIDAPKILGWLRLGPWMATTRIRQPRQTRIRANTRREARSNPDSSDPNSSPSCSRLPILGSSSPGSPPNSDEWQKHPKFARPCSPKKEMEIMIG